MDKNIRLPFSNFSQPSDGLPLTPPAPFIFTGYPTHQMPIYMIENPKHCRRVEPRVIVNPATNCVSRSAVALYSISFVLPLPGLHVRFTTALLGDALSRWDLHPLGNIIEFHLKERKTPTIWIYLGAIMHGLCVHSLNFFLDYSDIITSKPTIYCGHSIFTHLG